MYFNGSKLIVRTVFAVVDLIVVAVINVVVVNVAVGGPHGLSQRATSGPWAIDCPPMD